MSRTGLVGGGLGFTLCAWVYRTLAGSEWDRLIDFGNGPNDDNIILIFQYQMHYYVTHGSSASSLSASSAPSFPANVWTHVAVVQSRASLTDTYGPAQIYWNGVSVATTASMRFPLPVSRSNLYVGKDNWGGGGTGMFTGQMKDLLVWDVALSPAQLDGVRLGGGLPSTPAPLVSMMRTWCGAAPPPSPPPPPPPCPPPPPPSFPANVWTHVAVVQSRASLTDTYGPAQIYWSGVSVATTASMRFPLPVSRSNLYVGKSNWGDPMFTGQMKDLLVWDVALSPAQLD
eukprot:jgi/Chrpa1/24028/Chrysochromulina_OHIO_Genome00025764-RA